MPHPAVVVVDDNTDFLAFIETLLVFAGYTVFSCQRCSDAAAFIRKRRPDLVTLDLRMGEAEGGFDILADLRADPVTSAIPIVLCSADIEALETFAATNTEPHTHILAKPFEAHRLLELLNKLYSCRLLTP